MIPTYEYRRMAREAMRGHFPRLMLIALISLLTNLSFVGLSARALWLIGLTVALRLIHPMLDFGQKQCFTRRFRAEVYDFSLLFQYHRLPKLLGIWALRDAAPMALMTAGGLLRAGDPMNLTGQALESVALLATVVLAFNYCMAEYVLIDAPGLSPVEALRESRRRLSGQRFQLFFLMLSFMGWILLGSFALSVCFAILYPMPTGLLIALEIVIMTPLMTYIGMANIAFFETLSGRQAVRQSAVRRPALSPDEAKALEMLKRHHFSRRTMEADGSLDDFRALNLPPQTEVRWRHRWMRNILARYSYAPDAMDDLLLCAEEYVDSHALSEAVRVMDDALATGAVIEGALARQALDLARALQSGAFDAESKDYRDALDGLAELTDRLEARLGEIDPDGPWQSTLASIRELL